MTIIGSIIIVKSKSQTNDNGSKPVGIITERDVVRAIGTLNPPLLGVPIREIMSKPVITISAQNTIKDALQVMQQRNIRRLIITERETMIGIITDKDIFRSIMNNQSLIPGLLQDNTLMSYKSPIHDQFGEYWFSDIFHKP
jgi:signal-transduction protein with cAMP-binding, CBS, and nucleotidyltransferase domain